MPVRPHRLRILAVPRRQDPQPGAQPRQSLGHRPRGHRHRLSADHAFAEPHHAEFGDRQVDRAVPAGHRRLLGRNRRRSRRGRDGGERVRNLERVDPGVRRDALFDVAS